MPYRCAMHFFMLLYFLLFCIYERGGFLSSSSSSELSTTVVFVFLTLSFFLLLVLLRIFLKRDTISKSMTPTLIKTTERPYLSRFHSGCFLELALAQKEAVFFVLLIFLDSRPRKSLGWHRDFLLLALGVAAGKRGALQILPGEGLACTLPDP